MTIIRATCPTCGDVRLAASQVTVRICVGRQGGEYRWKCKCGIVVKWAEEHIIEILRGSGVAEEVWELPLEMMERPVDGTLSEDDLIDLEIAFANGTAFDQITKRHP